jgi:gamma-glutamyltranspeptidase/glutathione hydrolase
MNYAISAGHPATAAAADTILRAGGNAVDAAIAAFLMSWVAEPCMSSAGGGGFALVEMDGHAPILLDFFCQTPGWKRPAIEQDFYPITVDFGDTMEVFHVGKGSTGVPGSVDGLFQLYERFGSMPLKDLFEPAIAAAHDGLVVNGFQALDFKLLEPILAIDPQIKELFFGAGRLIREGEVLRLPAMADFLDYLWREGKEAFYRGEVAHKIIADYSHGGHLTRADFHRYQSIWRKPLEVPYGNHRVFTNPLPSIGGIRIAWFLESLLQEEKGTAPLDQQHLTSLMEAFRHIRRQPPTGIHGSTTHFSLTDRSGNAVSLTASNGEGCGYFVEGTDVQLNNMLGEAALLPQGFHSWQPNVRLSSMMAPTMVFSGPDRTLELVTGSSGAGRIPFAIAQVIHYALDYNLPINEAVNYARIHWQAGSWDVEPGFITEGVPLLPEEKLRVWQSQSLYFGGVNTVKVKHGVASAAADERREGAARVHD